MCEVEGSAFAGVDLIAAGIPCPPFSVAGKQLGHLDDRDLFPEVIRLVREARPTAVFIENVPGLLDANCEGYRKGVGEQLAELGYLAQMTQLQPKGFWRAAAPASHAHGCPPSRACGGLPVAEPDAP